MDDMDPRLQQDFERWMREIGDDPFTGPKTIGFEDVLRAHYLIVNHFLDQGIGGIGPRNVTLLGSTLGRQFSSFGQAIKWTDDLEICATLFFGLIKNHAFHDGNKRTAFLTLLYHLWKIGRMPSTRQRDFEILALRVASSSLDEYKQYAQFTSRPDPEVRFIASFLRKNTRVINKRNYMVTYRELRSILQRHDCDLQNPDGNWIDVVQYKDEYYWEFLRRKKRRVSNRVCRIGFPGWSREVGKSVVDNVRKATALTPEHGIDAEVFFRDATPLSGLIARYETLLERLADK